MKKIKVKLLISILIPFFIMGCSSTPSSLTPVSNADKSTYRGEGKFLIAVSGDEKRAVRHLVISTNEEPLGYEIYYHAEKPSKGFIVLDIPTPSTNVRVSEYSLTGHYGCSRGKAGYGSGSKSITKAVSGKTYFLGTIDTGMNTMYNEMPNKLMQEAKTKYNYTAQGEDIEKRDTFKSHISL